MRKLFVGLLFVAISGGLQAQELLSEIDTKEEKKKEFVRNAFKSSRVINGHSMEFIGKGVLDVRILHRFGELNSGARNLFGLDEANMRLGFDYGLSNRLTVGVGRSTAGKELDGFLKFRPVWQSTGPGSFPFSIVLVTGMTVSTTPWADTSHKYNFNHRMAFYNEVIIGRKFSEQLSLQVSPIFIHRNLVALATDENDVYAIGVGGRFKLSKRIAFVADYHYIAKGLDKKIYKDPLSVGFD